MTANSDVARLINNVVATLPGAMPSLVQFELFNVLNDFFQRTNLWTEDVSFTTVVGTTGYDVTQTSNPSSINRLMWVVDANGRSVPCAMPSPGHLVLQVTPSVSSVLTATLALTVSDPVDKDGNPVCPQWMVSKYGTGLLDGVMGRMMAQTMKPYSNPQMAAARLRSYSAMASEARVEAKRQTTYATQTWRFPQSFSVGRKGR